MADNKKRSLDDDSLEDVSGGYTRIGKNISFTEDENDVINRYNIGSKKNRERNHTYTKKNADRVEELLKGHGFKNGEMGR